MLGSARLGVRPKFACKNSRQIQTNGWSKMKFLKLIWKKWRAFGQVMGDFVARIIMTVFYFTVAIPFGVGVRLFKDPLHLKSGDTGWLKRETKPETLEDARRLY